MHFRTAMCGGEPCSGSSGTGLEFLARRISGVAIFPCEGGRDEAGERALGAAFGKGGAELDPVIPARRFAGRPMLAARAGLVPGLPLMHPAFYIRPARVEEAMCIRRRSASRSPRIAATVRCAKLGFLRTVRRF